MFQCHISRISERGQLPEQCPELGALGIDPGIVSCSTLIFRLDEVNRCSLCMLIGRREDYSLRALERVAALRIKVCLIPSLVFLALLPASSLCSIRVVSLQQDDGVVLQHMVLHSRRKANGSRSCHGL